VWLSFCISASTTPHIGDFDKAWKGQTTRSQRRYREWQYAFRRSGPSGQPCGSPKPRLNSLWAASAMREPSSIIYISRTTGTPQEVDIITSPPQQDPYTKVRTLNRLSPSKNHNHANISCTTTDLVHYFIYGTSITLILTYI
jgi:hypothetical protein